MASCRAGCGAHSSAGARRATRREGLRRLKAGPLEAEWEREILRTEAELNLPAVAPTDLGGLVSDDLGEVARRAPAAAVLEAFARPSGSFGGWSGRHRMPIAAAQ